MKISVKDAHIPHDYPVCDINNIPEEDGYFVDARYRFYGDVKCCNCGKMLGTASVQFDPATDLALVVGREDDDEGRAWRSFCPACAKKVAASEDSPSQIMRKYPASELV